MINIQNRVLLLMAILGSATCGVTTFGSLYSSSDGGVDLIIYPIKRTAAKQYFTRPFWAVCPLEIYADGKIVSGKTVSVSYEQDVVLVSKQDSDFVLLTGSLLSLIFVVDIVDGQPRFMQYELPRGSKVIRITYKPRYPDGALGESTTVVTKRENPDDTVITESLEDLQKRAAIIREERLKKK